jgi:uncharacterized protein
MSLYEASVPQFIKMLHNLEQWVDKAVAHATAKSFDPAVLLAARLAPDQYPLLRQIQVACDAAKFPTAYLSGKEAPRHPDTEQTLDEVRERIKKCLTFLGSVSAADFAGAEARKVQLPFLPGKYVLGADYLYEMALPNFYFHVTTAYAILRHNGVDVGKRDFIGGMKVHDA